MSEFLVCYDCGSVRDPEHHANLDCKTIAKLRAENKQLRQERDALDLLAQIHKGDLGRSQESLSRVVREPDAAQAQAEAWKIARRALGEGAK